MKILSQLAACALVLATLGSASAEPEMSRPAPRSTGEAPAPPSRWNVGPAPQSPEVVHFRHGFYLRGAIEGGYLSDAMTAGDGSSGKFYGGGGGLDFFLGGSVIPGLVLGGGFTFMSAPNASFETGGQVEKIPGSLNFTMLAGFVDFYPSPESGLHLMALAGFADLSVSDANGNSISDITATGPGVGVGVGYEWSLGTHWGLGVMGRYVYSPLEMSFEGVAVHESVTSPQLLLTGTYY